MKLRWAAKTHETSRAAPAAETDAAMPGLRSSIRYNRRRFLQFAGGGVLVATLAPVLAACEDAIDKRYTVEMHDEQNFDKEQGGSNGFTPSRLTIPVGSTVVWFNRGTQPHTATDDPSKAQNKTNAVLPKGVAPWDSGDVYPGESWTRTFDVPGNYVYFDHYQETLGMIGSITVTS